MKTLLLFSFLFFSSTAIAQQITFEKIIDTLGCVSANCIQETFDGGYVFGGTSNLGGNDVIIVKLDSAGTIEWVKIYSGPSMEGATYLEQTPDSGYMVNAIYDVGGPYTKSWLLKLNQQGDTLWTKIFSAGTGGTNPASVNSMASVVNTIYGMTGYFKPVPFTKGSPYFIANIGNGIQLANKIYDYNPFSTNGEAINKTFDGGFIITGQYGTGPVSADIHLIRTDTYGDTLWTRTYDYSQGDVGMAVQQTADSGFIVAGLNYDPSILHENIILIKTDINGDTVWIKNYSNSVSNNPFSVHQTLDNGYFISGVIAIPPNNIGNIFLIKTDANGDTLWTKQYGGANPDFAYYGKQTKDGGYIVSGIGAIGNKVGAYIIKLDSLGNVNSPSGMAELNNPFEFSVYPNPSSGVFHVMAKGLPHHKGQIEVYNINNQLLYSSPVGSQQPLTVNLTHATEGLYVVILRTGESVFTKKIIIHKP